MTVSIFRIPHPWVIYFNFTQSNLYFTPSPFSSNSYVLCIRKAYKCPQLHCKWLQPVNVLWSTMELKLQSIWKMLYFKDASQWLLFFTFELLTNLATKTAVIILLISVCRLHSVTLNSLILFGMPFSIHIYCHKMKSWHFNVSVDHHTVKFMALLECSIYSLLLSFTYCIGFYMCLVWWTPGS